jgi:hypothetical protein
MKYGESTFDVLYLILAITFFRVVKRNGKTAVNGAT